MLIDEPVYLQRYFDDFDTVIIAGTSLTVTSVFQYIKPNTDLYVVNKERIDLPLPTSMFKSVTVIQKDIVAGLQELKNLLQ